MPIIEETPPFEVSDNLAEYLARMFRDARNEDAFILNIVNGLNTISAVITDNAGNGTVSDDCNNTDFTGHANAIGRSLKLGKNQGLNVSHKDVVYFYTGAKGVLLGLDGDYATVDNEFSPISTSDHSLLNNRDAVDSHPISAITNLPTKHAEYDGHLANTTIHGKYYEASTEPVGAVDGSTWYDPL